MFEQSIVTARAANKTWTLGISILAQTFLISSAVILPLIYTNGLPALSSWLQGIVTLPAPERPKVLQVETSHPTSQNVTLHDPRVFVAPTHIPSTISREPDTVDPADWVINAVPGPVSVGNPISNFLPHTMPIPKPHDPPAHETLKPQVDTSAPHPVSGGVQEGKLLRRIVPIYPQLAIVAHVEGTVHLMGIISKEGTIRELQVIDGNPLLVRAALDAVRQWLYRPTLLTGEPVEVIAPIAVKFVLNK